MQNTPLQQEGTAKLTEPEIQKLLDFVQNKTGMVFAQRLRPWVLKQTEKIFKMSQLTSINEFVQNITSGKNLVETGALFDSLTVNETMFYRDKVYFSFMIDRMFPDLIEKRRSSKSLKIWIAAGSSGQEAYSIYFTLINKFPELIDWNIQITSTDICNEVINKAKQGIYEKHELDRGLPPEDATRFFTKLDDDNLQVRAEVRAKINFRQSNLVDDFKFVVPKADFISCRNVLIYFNDETKHDIIKRLGERVESGGYLLLGQVDYSNAGDTPEGFEYKMEKTFPYYINIK